MDGVAIALQAPEEAESEDADGEADEGHDDPHASDDSEKQLVHSVVNLEETTEGLQNAKKEIKKNDEGRKNIFFF